MIIEFIGYHDRNMSAELFKHLPRNVQANLSTLLKYDLPFESLIKYFQTTKLHEIIAKHSNYRLTQVEFLLQFYVAEQKTKARQRYDYNLEKERKLQQILTVEK